VKKITLVLPDLIAGGAQRIVLNLAKGFIENNYEVDLVLITNKGNFFNKIPHKVNLYRLSKSTDTGNLVSLPLSGLKFLHYLSKNKPDVLVSSLTGTNLFTLILKMLGRIKIPLIVIEHSVLTNVKSKTLKGLIKIIYPFANKIVCVSQGIRSDFQNLGINDNLLATINNPIDIEYINRQASIVCEHSWLRNKTTPIVIAVGRLVEAKGFDLLLRAFAQVITKTPARLIILGEGPLYEHLVNLAKKLEISQYVDFAGFADNPYNHIKLSDVFVLSSKWEGFVGVLLEAMALGTSVVATDCWASPAEILKNGHIGKLVPENNTAVLADAILQVLAKPQDSKILKDRAREFTIDKIAKKYIDLIDQAITG
jgi:glycosyltransferase involved in cell wall biosynthesis